MPIPTPLRNLLLWCAGSLLLWGMITLAFAAQLVFAAEVEWQPALQASIREWSPWAAFTPIVVALTIRFPFERGRWPLSLCVHLLGCTAVVAATGLLSQSLGGRDGSPPGPPWRRPFNPESGPPPSDERPEGPRRGGGPPRGPGNRADRPGPGGRGPLLMRARLNIPVYWIVVSATTAVLHSRRARERERRSLELAASLAQSRLATLRAQLQPHFLFNSLNAISTLVHRDPNAADEMISNLSDFLRLTLEHSESQELPLRNELEFVRRYLAIEQVRFGDRLRVIEQIPQDALDCLVPVLLLQPLVENALKHGIAPKRGPATLQITAVRSDHQLLLTIEDDGVGLGVAGNTRPGIGLSNTRSRLRELHGPRATVTLDAMPSGGTRTTVQLPARTETSTPKVSP